MKKKALIIGGTSGLGLELASLLRSHKYDTFITGRKTPPDKRGSTFIPLNLSKDDYLSSLNHQLMKIGSIDLLIYAAGFYQGGSLRDLAHQNIENMFRVGLVAPTMVLRAISQLQRQLPMFVAVTSTSQWTPRADEPVYCATKAGLAMLAESVSLDGSVGKTLTVGVSGMNTSFWNDIRRDTSAYLDPAWVASEVLSNLEDEYVFRSVKILRGPARVEVTKERLC